MKYQAKAPAAQEAVVASDVKVVAVTKDAKAAVAAVTTVTAAAVVAKDAKVVLTGTGIKAPVAVVSVISLANPAKSAPNAAEGFR